jgi:hypothetical protein
MSACPDAAAIAFLERLAGIDTGGVPGRRAAEEKTRERSGCKGEEKNRKVEGKIRFIRQGAARHDGYEALEHGVADADAEETSGDCEQQTFGDELFEDSSATRSERAADGEFLLAGQVAG